MLRTALIIIFLLLFSHIVVGQTELVVNVVYHDTLWKYFSKEENIQEENYQILIIDGDICFEVKDPFKYAFNILPKEIQEIILKRAKVNHGDIKI